MFRNLCDISKSLNQLSTTSMSRFFFWKRHVFPVFE